MRSTALSTGVPLCGFPRVGEQSSGIQDDPGPLNSICSPGPVAYLSLPPFYDALRIWILTQ